METKFAKEDLELIVDEKFDEFGIPAGMSAAFDFATDLFEPATIRRFADRLRLILDAVGREPATRIADIGILGADETAALVPASGAAATRARVWPEILAEAVASNPDAPALSSRERSMTYRELDEESTKLARALCRRGVGPEDFVALGLPRSTAEIVAIWAVTKTGAAFLPVDPNYPDDRINHMLDDSRAVLGITDDAHRSQLPDTVEWMVLDEAETVDEIEAQSAAAITDRDRTIPLHHGHPAYLIYTSGSTGKPKGVIVTHLGLSNLNAEEHQRFNVQPYSRISHLASPSFDASVFELMMRSAAERAWSSSHRRSSADPSWPKSLPTNTSHTRSSLRPRSARSKAPRYPNSAYSQSVAKPAHPNSWTSGAATVACSTDTDPPNPPSSQRQ